ncbi:MAG: hypothetical protein JWQ96_1958 [Segetibacter sp.]|nr:hypothetical protein [Segetibacter sp.]
MPTILITGGTGLIGTALTPMLVAKGYKVIILSRNKKESTDSNISYANWDVEEQTIDKDAIEQADHIIHLAGANVAEKRWTTDRKKEIVESRTKSCSLLVDSLNNIPNNVKTVISSSAIGFYGEDKKRNARKKAFTEELHADDSFLGNTCKQWEDGIKPLEQTGIRLVILRTGIVLSNDGGALAEFEKPIRYGLATMLGNGKQIISWIHIEDICRLFIFALENPEVKGIYNAVAPEPVPNKELIIELAQRLKGKFYVSMHVPAFMLKLGLGELSVEVLKSATVSSEKIKLAGFHFVYPTIEAALNQLAKR